MIKQTKPLGMNLYRSILSAKQHGLDFTTLGDDLRQKGFPDSDIADAKIKYEEIQIPDSLDLCGGDRGTSGPQKAAIAVSVNVVVASEAIVVATTAVAVAGNSGTGGGQDVGNSGGGGGGQFA